MEKYQGYCKECGKVIDTNMQGNETGSHDCGINVLSLFDGCSCGQQALERIGKKVNAYYASEIEKQPIVATKYNFPNTIQLGDVCKVNGAALPKIDLLIGGSPCQGFSRAGKQLNFDDPRSKLFFEFVRLYEECKAINPKVKFLLENVDMPKWCLGIISEKLGVFPVKINSTLVSAQNRVRWYWTNIRTRQEGFWGEIQTDIPQPEDKGIFLKHVLQPEEEVDEKYYLSDNFVAKLNIWAKRQQENGNGFKIELRDGEQKSTTLSTGSQKSGSQKSGSTYIKIDREGKAKGNQGKAKGNQGKASSLTIGGHGSGNHSDMDLFVVQGVVKKDGDLKDGDLKDGGNKANCIDANYGKGMDDHGQRTFIVAQRGRGENNEQQLETNTTGKTNTITSVAKDNYVVQLNPSKESNRQQPYQQNRVYDPEGKAPSCNAERPDKILIIPEATKQGYTEIEPGQCFDSENINSQTRRGRKMEDKSNAVMSKTTDFMQYTTDFRIRRLTPIEVCRLQTMKDDYFYDKEGKNIISDSAIYKAVGNGWTIDVIAHIFKYL